MTPNKKITQGEKSSRGCPEVMDRRTMVLQAAISAFAERGYYGTPTTEIAKRARISQPYIFKLFLTKERLFIAAIDYYTERILACFRRAVADSMDSSQTFKFLSRAYTDLMSDRDLLMVQLHAQSACSEPAIREAVQRSLERQIEFVWAITGGTDEEVKAFFGAGTLSHLILAVDAQAVDDRWARTLVGPPGGRV
ncbi:TetR/AcrR family transcriptional regulator [Streptomyces sp. NPDC002738]